MDVKARKNLLKRYLSFNLFSYIYNMKISFDFDDCLNDSKFVRLIAELFRNANHEIWILTSRDPSQPNIDVWKLAKEFDIPNERIIMTDGTLKVYKFMELKLDLHFDNSWDEVVAINDKFQNCDNKFAKNTSMPAILVNFDSEELHYSIISLLK